MGVQDIPLGWTIICSPHEGDILPSMEAIVEIKKKDGKRIAYKIYLEEITNDTKNMKIRIACKFDGLINYRWMNFTGDLEVAKELLTTDFEMGISFRFGCGFDKKWR